MANQISGSADATLVQAASKAAAASVPYDQSNTHRRLSRSYAKMAKATGDVWGKAIEVVGNVGSALVENAKSTNLDGAWEENQDQLVKDKTSGVNPDNKTGMVNVRNPKTGEAVEVEEKFIPRFKTGKEMRMKLNSKNNLFSSTKEIFIYESV